jgi:hypothetical protein
MEISNKLREKIRIERELYVSKNLTKCQEYKNLLNEINNFLYNHCDHQWLTDLIDITPEKSKYITYCEKCECTFKS